MSKMPYKPQTADATASGTLPFIRSESVDQKVRVSHVMRETAATFLDAVNLGGNVFIDNSQITEVEVIETRTIKLTRHEKLDDYLDR